ncbi:NAD(P)-dependent oxidoreductase [Hyphomicrobium sp. DY-1]|uniref:NAD(P)-dependent oxidoreductase n=1 Tax=Hyphomicrobium sp. DY-1 TaxID=3075650 RepID=UPI0039C04AAD
MSNANQETVSTRQGARIGPLATLPVFFKLDGKRVVLIGGGEPALWKAELLAATGALVEVFAEAFAEEFFALAEAPPRGQILLVQRGWSPEDLANAALAVGSFADEAEAATFAAAARAAGVPVNVVDRPALCDFQFGAIVNRSPLVVGISTDGAAPVFGQAIRSLVESLLPESFRLWAAAARDLRRESDRLGETPEQKRRFWRRFTDFALRHLDRGPGADDIAQLIAGEPEARTPEAVTVIGVGNDADMLTLGAVRALRGADDIFYDDDVQAAVLDFARREARRHPIASTQGGDTSAVVASAKSGRQVVRLRLNADAGRRGGGQELEALRAAGISVVVLSS